MVSCDPRLLHSDLSPAQALRRLLAERGRLLALADALPDNQRAWDGPCAEGLNPPRWEFGHIAWFQELWCLRRRPGRPPLASPLLAPLHPARIDWADWLFDSSRIPHAARWQAPLPSVAAIRTYAEAVLDALAERIANGWPEDDPDLPYYVELALYHEAMHREAWWMMWQRRALDPPSSPHCPIFPAMPPVEQVEMPGGCVPLGVAHTDASDAVDTPATRRFAFDNEFGGDVVRIDAFFIDSRPVTFGEFARFVDAGGYDEPRWWSEAGWQWRLRSEQPKTEQDTWQDQGADTVDRASPHPLYWRAAPAATPSAWQVRNFVRWAPLPSLEAVRHVSAYEAEAYARWCGRRLPSAAEWHWAATQRRTESAGEPGFVTGGVWEWTATPFRPYTGFVPGPYADYSLPWFDSHRELRGAGSVLTDRALARPDFRNFYLPHRQDVFAGFRTAMSHQAR